MASLADKMGLGPTREAEYRGGGIYKITVTPPAFMKLPGSTVTLDSNQYSRFLKWAKGDQLIQDILPDLTKAEREILMSGINDEKFHELFDDDEEDSREYTNK